MTRHQSRDGTAAARRSLTRPSLPDGRSAGPACEVRHRTAAAASGRSPKKTAMARIVAGASGKAAAQGELERQLAEAEVRILELEARLNGVTDRVAWIADRLHALLSEHD
jgi:hypothetical protein